MVVKVGLLSTPQTVQALWSGEGGSTINMDTFASMSALLMKQAGLVYADIQIQQNTSSQTPVPMTGQSFDLLAATTNYNAAVVTLDVPNLRLANTQATDIGADVSVLLSGVTTVATGSVSTDFNLQLISSNATIKPLTVTVLITLLSGIQSVAAEWNGTNNGSVYSDGFASLSAVLVKQ